MPITYTHTLKDEHGVASYKMEENENKRKKTHGYTYLYTKPTKTVYYIHLSNSIAGIV